MKEIKPGENKIILYGKLACSRRRTNFKLGEEPKKKKFKGFKFHKDRSWLKCIEKVYG